MSRQERSIQKVLTQVLHKLQRTRQCGDNGVVESVDASTMNRYDMSCFKLTAWTHSVEAIPTVRWLAVPEPETGGSLQVSAARRRPRYAAPSML
jgi:hypothetical protein